MSDQQQVQKKQKPKSRPQRWADAAAELQAAIGELEGAAQQYAEALEELRAVQEEYSEWKDSLPENLANSALGEKLEEVCNMDLEGDMLESAIEDARTIADEAEGVDLPRGFGRD